MPRITYTISDLYAYSMLVDKVAISDEQRKKFEVIEVGDPAPQVIKRKDMADERRDDKEKDKVDKYAPRRGGPRDNMMDNRRSNTMNNNNNSNSNNNNMNNINERFAPPPRAVRGGGNRNHETFEEGVKYELAQNAAHRKQLNETLAMESGRADAAAERAEGLQHQQRKEEAPKNEELDNLIAGMETERAANARRSRFFDTASAPNNNNNNSSAPSSSSAPVTTSGNSTAHVRNDWKTGDSSIWRDTRPAPQTTTGGGAGIPAFTTAAGVTNMNINPNVANGFAITGVNNNNNNSNIANARPMSFGAPSAHPASAAVANPMPATNSPLPGGATATPTPPTAATNKVWDATELEKMLRAGATPAAQPPAVTGSINAADLERMLMGNAAGGASQAGRPAGVMPAPMNVQPPQQQPVFQAGFPQPAWQTPAKQPGNLMGKMPMQQPMPQQMQVPMMMNRQFFVTPNGQQFMMAPQQPMFGGGMQQPPAFASTNPQLLYQMQMQQQQQQQQAQQNQKRH